MADRVLIAADDEPVSLNDMKLFLGMNNATDVARDSIIASQITSARQYAEDYTSRIIMKQTLINYSDSFQDVIELMPDLLSVTSVKYYDINAAQQTLSPSIYYVDTVNSRLVLVNGKSWPDTFVQPNCVSIEYIAGYATDDDVPQRIKDAIKFLVAHWENYQGSIEGVRLQTVPYAVNQLLGPFVDFRSWQ